MRALFRPSGSRRRAPGAGALLAAAQGYGLGGVSVGEGAIVRRAPLFSVIGGEVAPSLTMEALRLAQGASTFVLRSSDAGGGGGGAGPAVVEARNGAVEIPLSPDGATWLRYAGPRPERFVSAAAVLAGEAPDPTLEDKILGHIVIVAATAPGLERPAEPPLGVGAHPAEIHADVPEQAPTGVSLRRPDWAPGAEALAVAVVGLATGVATIGRSALIGLVLGGVLPGLALVGSWIAFHRGGLILSPATPVLSGAGLHTLLTALNCFRSGRESGAVRAQFERTGLPRVDFGVGLNTGLCSVGLMGSPRRLEYSCFGDAVNVASRLQDLA